MEFGKKFWCVTIVIGMKKKCIMRSFVIPTLQKILLGMTAARMRDNIFLYFLFIFCLKRRDYMRDPGRDYSGL
jgi:hypothetical protein